MFSENQEEITNCFKTIEMSIIQIGWQFYLQKKNAISFWKKRTIQEY